MEVRVGVSLGIHIYECTATTPINHREQYCGIADNPIFMKTHAVTL